MAKLPNSDNKSNIEVFNFRISPKLKKQLNELAGRSKGKSASSIIRELIESAYKRN